MSLKILETGTTNEFKDAEGIKGAQITLDWVQAQVFKGNVYHAYLGTATTPVTLDAAWANTDPDISIDVPNGRLIIPLRINVIMEAYGTTALFETMCLCSRTLAASSAGTAFVPINMKTRTGGGSNCSVYTGPTVTSGYTTGCFELFRNCQAKAVTIATAIDTSTWQNNVTEWSYLANGPAPVLEGNASLQIWATSQAASGYMNIYWVELDANAL
uniref:Uncharacterized protein n=1 Tax=viral metagenome TaxID=1070528 RepID=A0A6M3L351_9ZZZZ